MKESFSYAELQRLVEPDERSDHLAVTSIYLKELHEVARQNLVAATQESIALQLSYQEIQENDLNNQRNEIKPTKSADLKQKSKDFHAAQNIPLEEPQKQRRKKKTYTCTYNGCDRKFKWLAHYRYHHKTHMGTKTYRCHFDNCSRSFYTPQSLAVHRRTHTGEKPFVCPEIGCISSFNTNGNLKNHLRTHTGQKPYLCKKDGCQRRFAELSSLKKHLLVHSGLKPYSCALCSKRFSQIGSRNVHIQRFHSGEMLPPPPPPLSSEEPSDNHLDEPNTDLTELTTANMFMMSDQHSQDMFPVQDGLRMRNNCVILSQPITNMDQEMTEHPYNYHSDSLMSNDTVETTDTKVLVLGQPGKTVLISSNYMQDYSDTEIGSDVAIPSKLLFNKN